MVLPNLPNTSTQEKSNQLLSLPSSCAVVKTETIVPQESMLSNFNGYGSVGKSFACSQSVIFTFSNFSILLEFPTRLPTLLSEDDFTSLSWQKYRLPLKVTSCSNLLKQLPMVFHICTPESSTHLLLLSYLLQEKSIASLPLKGLMKIK